jgi:Cytochrome c3/Cytochrome c554 and c-prime
MRAVSGWRWLSKAAMAAALVPVAAQNPKPAASPVTCATCHAAVTNNYAHAPMRHAMVAAGANPVLNAHPDLKIEKDGYSYSIQTKDGKSTYTVSDGKETLTLPIRWPMGIHSQTWVLEKDGKYYEGLVSYFSGSNSLGTTPGDNKIVPHSVMEAMGRPLPIWETRECFDCHASGVKAGEALEPEKLKPGLECEHCHVGTEQHMVDAQNGDFKSRPPSLKKMDAESSANFCGKCHRSWDTVMRNGWFGPPFVRFQPYRLALSRCFTGNDPRISCLACHDPHAPVNHDAAFYDKKCLACHSGSATVASAAPVAADAPKTCPVAKANCASCHMPKMDLPHVPMQFTDHFIRIAKPGEPYPY